MIDPVTLTWRQRSTLMIGAVPIGEYWYVSPRKKWRWTLGIGVNMTDDTATEAEARSALENAARAALAAHDGDSL